MSHLDAFIGIDVAKAELVIHRHPAGTAWRTPNTKAGLIALGRRLKRLAADHRLKVGFRGLGRV